MMAARARMPSLLARRALGPRAISTHAEVTHMQTEPCVARSLRDVARDGPRVQALELPSSEDLVCRNLMCEHVGEACACRLALVLERAPKLETLDLRGNQLRALPDSAFALPQLTHLDASGNRLSTLPALVGQLTALETLDLRGNRLTALPLDALASLPRLRKVLVARNPALALPQDALPAALRGKVLQDEDEDEDEQASE